MSEQIKFLLNRFDPKTSHECTMALRETIQEIALVGLWRAKFFENAAFYGGTALRIFYGLDRYSEDMDFSLIKPDSNFSLEPYNRAVQTELESYGFSVQVEQKRKNNLTKIESAFIKANTYQKLLRIGIPDFTFKGLHARENLKVKFEIDTDPPQKFLTETKTLMQPIPIGIKIYRPSDLFAGKMHATLCRLWQKRVKGRDWYDFSWYVRRRTPLNLEHLQERMWQSGCLKQNTTLTKELFLQMLKTKISELDIANAVRDVQPFIHDQAQIATWSQELFLELTDMIEYL